MTREWPSLADLADQRRSISRATARRSRITDADVERSRICSPARSQVVTRQRGKMRAHSCDLIGTAGWLNAIADQDLRTLCVTREITAAMSPLADAVLRCKASAAHRLCSRARKHSGRVAARHHRGARHERLRHDGARGGIGCRGAPHDGAARWHVVGHRRREAPHLQCRPRRCLRRVCADLAWAGKSRYLGIRGTRRRARAVVRGRSGARRTASARASAVR